MNLALLATTLLALLLTSTCIASAPQYNQEDVEGYSNMLSKRYLKGNSPPPPPPVGLGRGKPGALKQRMKEEKERQRREQFTAGPSRLSFEQSRIPRSTGRKAVRPAKRQAEEMFASSDDSINQLDDEEMFAMSDNPIDESDDEEMMAISSDPIDQLDDEETDDEETESDSWRTKEHESAWRYKDVPMTVMGKGKHFGDVAGSKSSRPSEEKRKRFKTIPNIYKSTSTTPSPSNSPSGTHVVSSPSWEISGHAQIPSHPFLTHNDREHNSLGPWTLRTGVSTRSSSRALPAARATASSSSELPNHTPVSSRSSTDDERPIAEWKQQRDLQRGKSISTNQSKRENFTFRDYFLASKPCYQASGELTPEQFSFLLSAKSQQDFKVLRRQIRNPFKLTRNQRKALKNEKKDDKIKKRMHNFQSRTKERAKKRERKWQELKEKGVLDAPRSYLDTPLDKLRTLHFALARLVKDIDAIEAGQECPDPVDDCKLRLVDKWTQEDLDWWKGYIEFRKAFSAVPQIEELIKKIEHFFTLGKGRDRKPRNRTKEKKWAQFRPPIAYEEAFLAKQKALHSATPPVLA